MRKKPGALVTGASSGIGREIPRELQGDGFVVLDTLGAIAIKMDIMIEKTSPMPSP